MIYLKNSLLIFFTLFLINCSLFSSAYTKPQITPPKHWSNCEKCISESSTINISKLEWWNKFNDPILNQLIEQALDNNNSIQIAIGNILKAQGILKKIRSNWIPTVYLGGIGSAGQSFNFSSGSNNLIVNSTVPNNSNFYYYEAGLLPTYSMNIFQQFSQEDMAKSNLAAAKYNKDAIQIAVISQIVGSYFTVIALQEQLSEQKQITSDIEKLVELNNIQYRDGLISYSEIEIYKQQLEQVVLQIPEIEYSIIQAKNAINILLNKNPEKLIINRQFESIIIDNIFLPNLPSSVLLQRPDVMQAEENLKMANADIGIAKANFFPHIYLTTPIGSLNSNTGQLLNPNGDFWATQAGILMPILDLGVSGLIKEKKGAYYIAYYNYIQTLRQAFIDADNNISAYIKAQNSYKVINRLFISTNKSYTNNLINYQAGLMSLLEILPSKITLDNTKVNVTKAKLQQIQSLITLYQAFGGGYNYKDNNTPKKFNDTHDI